MDIIWDSKIGEDYEGLIVHKLRPQSHPTFRPVLAMKLLGIMLRNRCWPATLYTITTEILTDGTRSGRCDRPLNYISLLICVTWPNTSNYFQMSIVLLFDSSQYRRW
jgi:hypothetical protein